MTRWDAEGTVASRPMRVTVVGELVLDRFRAADGSVEDVAGGSPANVALALHRAGVTSDLRARFSTDPAGRFLKNYLSTQGVNLAHAIDTDDRALIFLATVAADGSATYDFDLAGAADFQWTADELAPVEPGTTLIHAGSLGAGIKPGGAVIRSWAVSQNVAISYDVNARPAAWSSEEDRYDNAGEVQQWCNVASLIKASDEDIENLLPTTHWQAWAAAQSEQDAPHGTPGAGKTVVITRGGDGAIAFRNGTVIAETTPTPVEVIDTVGAGDTFMAWLIDGYITHGFTAAGEIQRTLDIAARAAAINCTRRGCNPPARDEVV